MNRAIALLLPLLLAPSGCIIYENNGDQDLNPGDWWNDGSTDTSNPGDTSDTAEVPTPSGLVATPDHAEAGQTLLITLTSTVELDLSLVVDVSFTADVTIHQFTAEADQVLIVATIDPNATTGTSTIDVELADGQVLTVDLPFTVTPPGAPEDTGGCP